MKKNNIKPDLRQIIEVDKLIHEPARIAILSLLHVVDSADFLFIMNHTGLTQGNLSSHLTKLEDASMIKIVKSFKGKKPHTTVELTKKGKEKFENYLSSMKGFLGNI
jgi:DNA-binding MarR family transcriptional regulator